MKKNNKITAKGDYNNSTIRKLHNIEYYQANEFLQKNLKLIRNESSRLKTENKPIVTEKISNVTREICSEEKVFKILENIYFKNQDKAFEINNDKIINSNLLNILAEPALLFLAYKKVRKNPGAMTKSFDMSKQSYSKLKEEQKKYINETKNAPDGITSKIIKITGKLIKENRYPWGASRRIFVDKPGKKDAKRPITIPTFMDKIVQEGIKIILNVIYEPYFESQNCSFGFRPNKGVHDAIISITGGDSIGLNTALEGDIKSAYDKVDRKILIEILGQKIQDRKFLNFIKNRLNYEYYDIIQKKYIRPIEGLPQGGIDSPYLWNIYMLPFDEYVNTYLKNKLKELNIKNRETNNKRKIINPRKRKIERILATLNKIKAWIKENNDKDIIKNLEILKSQTVKEINEKKIITGELHSFQILIKKIKVGETTNIEEIKKNLNNLIKEYEQEGLKTPTTNPNKIRWRLIYARFADDWIILTNTKKCQLEVIKMEIKNFLENKLKATLSEEKTLITDIRNKSAHFLGFEIKTYKSFKKGTYLRKFKEKTTKVTAKIGGYKVFALPDRQRIINNLHIKRYCQKDGFPREIGFLTSLDDFTIIERYNSVLSGLVNYYCEFIKNPKRNLSRWIYIIRFSCLKTFAQKHKMSIRQVFKKYAKKKNRFDKSRQTTIKATVRNIIDKEIYEKDWVLKTNEELIDEAFALKRKEKLYDIYWTLKKKEPIIYENQGKSAITNDDFYNKLNWTKIRTKASFDMGCSICGSIENIEMHHIKHIRKNKYSLLKTTWEQAMSLRNRKQIPLCRSCHLLVHSGKLINNEKLSKFSPKFMYDDRIMTLENYIKPANLNEIQKKSLLDKNWKIVN